MADKTKQSSDDAVKVLIARKKSADKVKSEWRALLQDAYEFGLPQRNLFYNDTAKGASQGQRKIDRVFDSTAQTATIGFANRIQSDMMRPFTQFIKLQAGPMVPKNLKEQVNKRLEFINDQLFAVMSASNWDTANGEVLLDLAVGTGVLFIFEGPEVGTPVMYMPAPIGRCALEVGAYGDTVGVYVDHYQMKVRDIVPTWSDAKVPDAIKNKEKDKKEGEDPSVDLFAACVMDPKTKYWHYKVIHEESLSVLVDRTYKRRVVVTPRWIKVAGETYGRGPLIQALPDIKTLNKLVELVLRNAALVIAGVYTGVADNVLNPNRVRIQPGAVIPVAANGGPRGPSLQALERSGSFDLAAIVKQDLVDNIRKFMLDKSLPPDVGAQPRSATEIIARMRELASDIGSPYGRLIREYIVPVVQSTLTIMEKLGIVPAVKVDGLAVAVQVVSPLAQEQNLAEVESIVQWLGILQSMGEEVPAMTAKIEEIGPHIGQKMGVPASLIRDDDEQKKIQTMVAGMVQQRMQAASPAPGAAPGADGQLQLAA